MRLRLSLRHKELLTSAFILLITVGTLGAAEAALRLNQILSFGTTASLEDSKLFFVEEETGLRKPIPGSVHGRIHFNSLGFRSPELESPKPEGTIRVAFLGSSTTSDLFTTPLENSWPAVTVQTLSEHFPSCQFDYLNAGVPGLSTRWLSIYYEQIKQLEPDLVIVLTNDRNVDLDRIAQEKGVHDGVHYRASWLAKHSLFWGKIEKNAHIISLQRGAFKTAGKLAFSADELLDTFEPKLVKLVEDIEASGALPVLINNDGQLREQQDPAAQVAAAATALFYMPYMSIDGLFKSREIYNEAILRVAGKTDAIYLDRRDVLPGTEEFFADSQHFNARGSRAIGEFVGSSLALEPRVLKMLETRAGYQSQRGTCSL